MIDQLLVFVEAVNRVFNMLPMDWVYVPIAISALFVPIRKYRLYKNAEGWFKSERFTDFMVIAIVVAEIAVDYFANNPDIPAQWVGLQAVVSALAANKGYIFIVKPAYNKIRTKLDPRIQLAKKIAAEIAQEKARSVVPKDMDDVLLSSYNEAVMTPAYLNPTSEAVPQDFTKQ